MKIGFIFTDQPDLAQVPHDERLNSYFEVPDNVKFLPDVQAQIIAIGELVGKFSCVHMHLNCLDIGIENYSATSMATRAEPSRDLFASARISSAHFGGFIGKKAQLSKRSLTIYAPIAPPHLQRGEDRYAAEAVYGQSIKALSEQMLVLLNVDETLKRWNFVKFESYIVHNALVTRINKKISKSISENVKKVREEEKRIAREAKLAEKLASAPSPQAPLTHGAGRTIGARPGIYKGIQMRSQLENRFAAELDERGIQWIYEGEALGNESYLVDFYLPALGVWVEVKGKFEARDRQVLPEIAKYLKAERQHRLLVYTGAGKCCVVNPSGFREVERKNFWGELLK